MHVHIPHTDYHKNLGLIMSEAGTETTKALLPVLTKFCHYYIVF